MKDIVMDFLCRAAAVDGLDPEEPVNIAAMLDRLGFVEDPDPESADYTAACLIEKYGPVVPFWRVGRVLSHIATSEFGPEWRDGQAAFFEEVCAVLNGAMSDLFSFGQKVH